MKLGFNEANDRFCKNHSVMMDLELCEKYGFDCIDIQSECLNRDLEAGKITLEEMGAWFQSHHLKMLSYNALCFFNMKQTQEEKDAVMAELDEIIRRCNILGCKMIVVVPSKDMKERGLTPTRKEIREDAVAVLKEMVKKCEPHGSRLSLAENIAVTKQVADFAHANDIACEAELGSVMGHEGAGANMDYEEIFRTKKGFTDLGEAKQFAEETKCDWLSVAVGSIRLLWVSMMVKFSPKARLSRTHSS